MNERLTWSTCLVFGDSIAYGAKDEEAGGWVDRLKADFDHDPAPRTEVYNLGVDGTRTDDTLSRIDIEASARNARTIVPAIAANDLSWTDGRPNTGFESFEHDYRALVAR